MPTSETVLENFDVIILDNYATRTLSTQQIATLRMWINRGGILLTVGGTYWQKTLFRCLPISSRKRAEAGSPATTTHLLTFNGQNIANNSLISDIDTTSLTPSISTAEIHQNSAFSSIETLLSSNGTPLVIQAHLGSGQIGYISCDPAGAPLDRWSSAYAFWQAVLESALGDKLLIATGSQSYDAGPGQITRGGLVSFLTPRYAAGYDRYCVADHRIHLTAGACTCPAVADTSAMETVQLTHGNEHDIDLFPALLWDSLLSEQ